MSRVPAQVEKLTGCTRSRWETARKEQQQQQQQPQSAVAARQPVQQQQQQHSSIYVPQQQQLQQQQQHQQQQQPSQPQHQQPARVQQQQQQQQQQPSHHFQATHAQQQQTQQQMHPQPYLQQQQHCRQTMVRAPVQPSMYVAQSAYQPQPQPLQHQTYQPQASAGGYGVQQHVQRQQASGYAPQAPSYGQQPAHMAYGGSMQPAQLAAAANSQLLQAHFERLAKEAPYTEEGQSEEPWQS